MAEGHQIDYTNRLSEEIKALVCGANFAHLATLMRDGSPQVDSVWVDLEGDAILVCTGAGSLKPRTQSAMRGSDCPSLRRTIPTRKPRSAAGSSSSAPIQTSR
jgi:hypothetical protein